MQNFQTIESTTVVGVGHCGRQIEYLLARGGVAVTCYEPNHELLEKTQHQFLKFFGVASLQTKPNPLRILPRQPKDAVSARHVPISEIQWTTSISLACKNDLIIEAVQESLELKGSVMESFFPQSSAETLFATNSSYLLPSSIFRGFPNPERFAALHFHVPPWFATAVDLMPSSRTDPEVLSRLVELVHRIGLDPILLCREFPGYVFNNLLNPLLVKAMELAKRQLCSPAEIERSWKSITQMPVGPFGMMQQIGLPSLRTILDNAVTRINDSSTQRSHRFIHQWVGTLVEPNNSYTACTKSEKKHFNDVTDTSNNNLDNKQSISSEVVWAEKENFLPIQHAIADRLRLAVRNGSFSQCVEQLASDHIFLWPFSFPEDATQLSERLSLSMTNVSEELIQQIWGLRKWQQAQKGPGCDKPTCFVCLRNTGHNLAYGFNCSTGMIRSLWLELKGQQQANLIDGDNQEALPSVFLLEIDLDSIPSKKKASQPTFSHDPPSFDVECSCKLVREFAHLHQRFERGTWQRPTLRPLQLPNTWIPAKQLLNISHWIVSGGGRGITFQMVLLLGIHGARLELLGRTTLPSTPWHEKSEAEIKQARETIIRDAAARKTSLPRAQTCFDSEVELSRNISALRKLGIDFRYHQVDVAERDELWALYSSIFSSNRTLNGILHGAGFEQTGLLWKKPIDSIRKTVESKVRGSLNLQTLVSKETRWFIQCGSLTGFFGGIGQVDYAAANSFLAEQAQQLKIQWPQMHCLTIGWPGWDGVGKATRASSKWSLEKAGHKLMSLEEGRRQFMTLIEKQMSGSVLICNPKEITPVFFEKASR